MQDIFARMKQKQFTDRLLQDMVKEFGLPYNSPNLHDTLLNMAACSSKEAACFWLTSETDCLTVKMAAVVKDGFVGDEALFDKIVEALRDAS